MHYSCAHLSSFKENLMFVLCCSIFAFFACKHLFAYLSCKKQNKMHSGYIVFKSVTLTIQMSWLMYEDISNSILVTTIVKILGK